MPRYPEHNENPVVTSAVIVVVATVLLFGGGWVIGLSPKLKVEQLPSFLWRASCWVPGPAKRLDLSLA
jgi:hypothetical protein